MPRSMRSRTELGLLVFFRKACRIALRRNEHMESCSMLSSELTSHFFEAPVSQLDWLPLLSLVAAEHSWLTGLLDRSQRTLALRYLYGARGLNANATLPARACRFDAIDGCEMS